MKKLLLLIGLALTCSMLYGQIIYTPTSPQNRPQQNNYQNQNNYQYQNQNNNQYQETIRATAYCQASNGQLTKMAIKVQQSQGFASYYVVAYYNYSMGQWIELSSSTQIPVHKCMRTYYDTLDNHFMYKAFINSNYYYFDL